ncbi:MAG: hypothetical protein ABH919_00800 [bacterium]
MDFLEKIRSLPLEKRKMILWAVTAVLTVCLLGWWFNNLSQKMKEFEPAKSFKDLPAINLEEEFKDVPKIEIPSEILDEINKIEQE